MTWRHSISVECGSKITRGSSALLFGLVLNTALGSGLADARGKPSGDVTQGGLDQSEILAAVPADRIEAWREQHPRSQEQHSELPTSRLRANSFGDGPRWAALGLRTGRPGPLQARNRVADDWLRTWLGTLVIQIPETQIPAKDGVSGTISGTCKDISINGILSGTIPDLGISVTAKGLGLNCQLSITANVPVIGTVSSDIDASIKDTDIGGPIALTSDEGNPPFPKDIKTYGCKADVTTIDLSFSNVALKMLSPLIKEVLQYELGSIICDGVDQLINEQGSAALRNASEILRTFLSKASAPVHPVNLPGKPTDYIDFLKNPGTQMIGQLVDQVFGNPDSKYHINKALTYLLGEGGNLSLAVLGLVPLKLDYDIADIASLQISIPNASVRGLDEWSGLGLHAPTGQQFNLTMGLNNLGAAASVELAVQFNNPHSPLHGDTLTEKFVFDLSLTGFATGVAGQVAVKKNGLSDLKLNQLAAPGCLSDSVVSLLDTGGMLNLAGVSPSLLPMSGDGLEEDLDHMLNLVVGFVMTEYYQVLEVVGAHLVTVTLRDMVNSKIDSLFSESQSCPAPTPVYASKWLQQCSVWLAVVLGVLSIVIPIGHGCSQRSKKARQARLIEGGQPLTDGAASAGLPPGGVALDLGSPAGSPTTLELGPEPRGEHKPEAAPRSGGMSAVEHHRDYGQVPDSMLQTDGVGAATYELEAVSCVALAMNPKLSFSLRVALPILVVMDICLFMVSNASVAVQVMAYVSANGESVVELPPVVEFSLLGSVRSMWLGGVYPLAIIIFVFSGIWPNVKLLMMLACWLLPPTKMKIVTRQFWLDVLDVTGKWSLVDSIVMTLFMVAFEVNLDTATYQNPVVKDIFREIGAQGQIRVAVKACWPFYFLVFATLLSLVLSHVMSAAHRYAHKIGEFGNSQVGEIAVDQKSRLCMALKPLDRVRGVFFVWGPVVALLVSLLLVIVGIFIDTFEFTFLGLAGFVFPPDQRVRSFSTWTLAKAVPGAAPDPSDPAVHLLQWTFMLFTAITPIVFHALLLVLWCAPMTNRLQRHFLIACKCMLSWTMLDIFALAVVACIAEIQQFIKTEIIGGKCDGINKILAKSALAPLLPGAPVCFDVKTSLKEGYWILLVATIISTIVGFYLNNRCEHALQSGYANASILSSIVPGPRSTSRRPTGDLDEWGHEF